MSNPLVIDIDDIIKLNDEPSRWKVNNFSYNNVDPTLATQITLDVEEDFGMGAAKQIDVDTHLVLDNHGNHYDIIGFEEKPEENQIILNVTFAHPS